MHAAILHVLTGDSDSDTLESQLGDGLPAADVERTDYLDGTHIHHGTLAGKIEEDTEVPHVDDSGIRTEQVEQFRQVTTDFYADLEQGWAGVGSSDGVDILKGYLLGQVGMMPEDGEIRLDAWAESLERDDDADVWGVVYSQSIEDGHDRDRAAAKYHGDAAKHSMPTDGKSVIGFEYPWDGRYVRGTLTASGYVAVYTDWPVDRFAAWVAEEVAPYLQLETDSQAELPGEECEGCGRESESIEDGYCIVCRDGGAADA